MKRWDVFAEVDNGVGGRRRIGADVEVDMYIQVKQLRGERMVRYG